jgi:hypothetical protein
VSCRVVNIALSLQTAEPKKGGLGDNNCLNLIQFNYSVLIVKIKSVLV